MSDVQLALGEWDTESIGLDIAARAVDHVRIEYHSDVAKLREKIAAGGTVADMRAAVQAYDALSGTLRELQRATDMIINPKEVDDDNE